MSDHRIFIILGNSNSKFECSGSKDDEKYDFLIIKPYGMKGHWAERLFQWAMAQNIINGYPDSSLKPDEPISEAEFLKALYRALGMALPSASSPEGNDDWTDGPYRLAESFNHPTSGASNHKLRMEPLTKSRASEIICAVQGVHYEGEDAVVYLIGNGMANSDAITPEQFNGQDSFSRAEAIQWIRQLSFKGVLDILKGQPLHRIAHFYRLYHLQPSSVFQISALNLSREMTSIYLEIVLLLR